LYSRTKTELNYKTAKYYNLLIDGWQKAKKGSTMWNEKKFDMAAKKLPKLYSQEKTATEAAATEAGQKTGSISKTSS